MMTGPDLPVILAMEVLDALESMTGGIWMFAMNWL